MGEECIGIRVILAVILGVLKKKNVFSPSSRSSGTLKMFGLTKRKEEQDALKKSGGGALMRQMSRRSKFLLMRDFKVACFSLIFTFAVGLEYPDLTFDILESSCEAFFLLLYPAR